MRRKRPQPRIVNVTVSGVDRSSAYFPKNAANLEAKSFFISDGISNSWICRDFKEQRVLPTSYAVKLFERGHGQWNLKSWVLEVKKSRDGSNWTAVDHDLVTRNFTISQIPKEAAQFIRLRQLAN